MKLRIVKIKKGEPIVIKEALSHMTYFHDDDNSSEILERKKIWNKVYYDGEISHVAEIEEEADSFHFGFLRDYEGAIDTLKTKFITFKDVKFVATVLKAMEGRSMYNGRGYGYLEIDKELIIYLKSILSLPSAIRALITDESYISDYDDIKEPTHSK